MKTLRAICVLVLIVVIAEVFGYGIEGFFLKIKPDYPDFKIHECLSLCFIFMILGLCLGINICKKYD